MNEIAIDVVLLLPDKIRDLAIEINDTATKQGKMTDALEKDDHIPHITLVMGIVKQSDLPEVVKIVENQTKDLKSLKLKILEIEASSKEPDQQSYFKIENTPEIQELHEKLTKEISPMFVQSTDFDVLYDERRMSKNTAEFLNNFVKKSAYKNYWPHVTLRCPKTDVGKYPLEFETKEVALFHVGDGATCRRLIKKY